MNERQRNEKQKATTVPAYSKSAPAPTNNINAKADAFWSQPEVRQRREEARERERIENMKPSMSGPLSPHPPSDSLPRAVTQSRQIK